MMEQTQACKTHHHTIFVAGCDHMVITDRSARLCHIVHATLVGTLNIVAEGEEGIGSKGHIRILIQT